MIKLLKCGSLVVIVTLLSFGLSASSTIGAETFPSKPIELIVGYKPGGQIDTCARVLAKSMGDILGQPVVVVNKDGAGGLKAINLIKNAKPDGYTLCNTVALPYTFIPHVREVEFTLDDFQFVAATAKLVHMSLVSLPDKPWGNFKELVAYAKKNPNLTFASISSTDKSVLKYIGKEEGIKWNAVPVKGGAGMVTDVLGGHVDFGFSGGNHISYANAGKMKVLALFGSERVPEFPDVPTLKESGYNIAVDNYNIVTAPKGVKKDVLDKLADAFSKAASDPKYVDMIKNKYNNKATFLGPVELQQYIASQSKATKEMLDQSK